MDQSFNIFNHFNRLFINAGLNRESYGALLNLFDIIISLIIAIGLFYIIQRFAIRYINKLIRRSKTKWDDIMMEKGVFKRLILLIPAILLHILLPMALVGNPETLIFFQKILNIYIIFVIALVINSGLNAANGIYSYYQVSKTRPLKGVVQALTIINYFIALIMIFSIIRNIEIGKIFIGLGTVSAVLLLVFKDSLLGFVGGIQISMNHLVQIGDWITMQKHGADGTVIDITLTTVKVQNFDNTIITIPTYSLIADSFQNWRGMTESGGRRIKRSIMIDVQTIQFCSDEMLKDLSEICLIEDYIKKTQEEVNQYNQKHHYDCNMIVNGRRQTNVGIFRIYIEEYLKKHPMIYNSGFTFMVRQLQPNEKGLPIEIYVSTKTTNWVEYEKIMSDIFDHLFASVPFFYLRVAQIPLGYDIQTAITKLKE
ncbi:MAG: mechanosensitive ion channel family protein [Bacteroidales bacterium]